MADQYKLCVMLLIVSNVIIIITTIRTLGKNTTNLIPGTVETNITPCIPNASDVLTEGRSPETEYRVCSSLSDHIIDVPATTRVFFKDGSFACISNMGQVDGIGADGGLAWYTNDMPHWEHTTFLIFRALIKPDMVYVGFGEWIGPTVLYSAQFAKMSYGFEPDAIAFRSLALNAKANQCFGDRLKVFSTCIYMHSGRLIMKDANGGSVSSIVDATSPGSDPTGPTTSVQCVTLEHVLHNHSLLDERLFLKVDTEGAEALLVPSLVPLVRKLKHRPVWFLSKHSNARYSDPQVQRGFRELASMYRCNRYSPASHQTALSPEQMLNFKVSSLPSIDDRIISNPNSNPDLILVDVECATVDEWIREVAHLFAVK